MSNRKDHLATRFRELGAPDPERWAEQQVESDRPLLHVVAFLKQAYQKLVAKEDDERWIEGILSSSSPADWALADCIRRAQAKGATSQQIIDLARCVQVKALFDLCFLLNDNLEDEPISLDWGLFAVNPPATPSKSMYDLHRSVLRLDPCGRDMRPRPEQYEVKH